MRSQKLTILRLRSWTASNRPPLPPPPPRISGTGCVAVLAHVDHGKTTLLDALLSTDVAAYEAGGITQCVRPSLLPLSADDAIEDDADAEKTLSPFVKSPSAHANAVRTLAFIDTPGHGVFSNMRAAAADGADLALILVAADAGVQPQTREVIRRCAERSQPLLFALTKADLVAEDATDLVSASQSERVEALRTELRSLYADELQRAGASLPHHHSGGADTMEIPVLSAPNNLGLSELLKTLRKRLGAITPPFGMSSAMWTSASRS